MRETKVLRDFIYLDVDLISSYLEQLTGGTPNSAEVSRESRGGGGGGINMALLQLQLEGGGRKGYRENQTIYWSRYARLEEALNNAGILVDLTSSISLVKRLEPNMIFLARGHATFEPDWANWQSGVSLVSLALEVIPQLDTLGTVAQLPSGESEVVSNLEDTEARKIVSVDQVAISQLAKLIPYSEPPEKVRRLFKPSAVMIRISIGESSDMRILEGGCALEHFTPHRLQPYLEGPIEEDVYVLGLVRQREDKLLHFIPLTLSVCIKGISKKEKRVRR